MCVFAIHRNTYTLVGQFDEAFYPAYFEDNDYKYRLKLKNVDSQIQTFLDPIIYRNSMSMQKDKALASGFMKNRDYYIAKWGGRPGEEKFDKPFNK
jgi:GT2 family glycosyltransferase